MPEYLDKDADGVVQVWPSGDLVPKGPRIGVSPTGKAPRKRPVLGDMVGRKPREHPEMGAKRLLWEFLSASYKGGPSYKSARDAEGKPVFVEHETESPTSSQRRKRLSPYRNFCRPIVQKFLAFVFGSPVLRDKDKAFREWAEDVDGQGEELDDFVERAMRESRIMGRWFVIADTTKPEQAMTMSQARAAGSRMVLRHVHPANVVDWADDWSWMLCRHDGLGEHGALRLWDQAAFQTAWLDAKGKVASVGAPEAHGWDSCPLVRVHGESLIEDVAEMNKAMYNIDSVLREESNKQTFTSWAAVGISSDEIEDRCYNATGSRKLLCVNKKDVTFHQLSGDVSQAESLRQTLEMDRRDVYGMVGLRVPDAVVRPESGTALRIRFSETAALAERMADDAERLESDVVDLWNSANSAGVAHPEYPEEFDEEDLQQELKDALDMVGSRAFPDTVKAEVVVQYVKKKLHGMEPAVLAMLEQDVRAAFASGEAAPEPPAVPGAPGTTPGGAREKAEHPQLAPGQAERVARQHEDMGK